MFFDGLVMGFVIFVVLCVKIGDIDKVYVLFIYSYCFNGVLLFGVLVECVGGRGVSFYFIIGVGGVL